MRIAGRVWSALIFVVLAVAAGGVQVAAGEAASVRPNVLFIMADDYRAEMGAYGSPAKTPNLDRLAAGARVFRRAYCQQAVCNPSRSSLLTGRRPDALQIWNNSVHFRERNPDVMTLPLWFRRHGYQARCAGKIFHNWHTKIHGDPVSWSAPEFLHFANHGDDSPQGDQPPASAPMQTPLRYGAGPLCEMRDVPDEAYYDGRVAHEAVRVLAEVGEQPFFLAVGFWKPHAPFNAPRKYWELYQRGDFEKFNGTRPEGAPALAFHKSTEILGKNGDVESLPNAQAAEMRHGYFANITYLDAQVGRVLDGLAASGVADRTIVVFLSDHGYQVGEHGLWGKTSNFEYDARVPLLIRDPAGAAVPGPTDSLAELIDLFPTLTELCGLHQPDGLQGTSLVPVLQNAEVRVKAAAMTQHPRPAYYDRSPAGQPQLMGYSVRTAAARYTEWRDWATGRTTARELYLQSDEPAELQNVVDDPAAAGVLRECVELLAGARGATDGFGPRINTD